MNEKGEYEVKQIAAQVHGRYLVELPSGEAPYSVVVCFHGYGESAEDTLEDLSVLAVDSSHLLVSIQALHPFYRGKSGDVVASWMTKLDRELAVSDNVTYVDSVLSEVYSAHPVRSTLYYVGFSQGASMAYRAACLGKREARGIVALGGDIPPELTPEQLGVLPPVLIGRGREDKFYPSEQLSRDASRLTEVGISVSHCEFEGEHEWTGEFLQRVRKFFTDG